MAGGRASEPGDSLRFTETAAGHGQKIYPEKQKVRRTFCFFHKDDVIILVFTPETPILSSIHRAPKIEVLRLADMVRVHAKAAIVHKLGGAHENIVNNFFHVIGRPVIDAVPLRNSPALLILGTITCTRQPVSPSNICGRTGEATELKPA